MHGNGDEPPFLFTMDDGLRMARITRACKDEDWGAAARMLREYYADAERAHRMPRQMLYFHLDQMALALARAAGEPMDDDDVA